MSEHVCSKSGLPMAYWLIGECPACVAESASPPPAVTGEAMTGFLTEAEEQERSLSHSLNVLLDYTVSAENKRHHAAKIQTMFTRLRASGTADERLRATEPEPGGTYRPVRDDNGWGQLRMEYVPPYVLSEEQTTRLLNTLSKAWPVLAEHANWMDGTFDLALTDLRNDVAALHKAVARLRASLPSEREGQR